MVRHEGESGPASGGYPPNPQASSYPPRPGDLLVGKDEVERVLGIGGMGVVLAAHHKHMARLVAIKLMLPNAMSTETTERFLREARAAIPNPHVPKPGSSSAAARVARTPATDSSAWGFGGYPHDIGGAGPDAVERRGHEGHTRAGLEAIHAHTCVIPRARDCGSELDPRGFGSRQ